MAKVKIQRNNPGVQPVQRATEESKPQNMAVYVSLKNQGGVAEDVLMGWVIPEYDIPTSLSSAGSTKASVFVYSKEYIQRQGPAIAGPVVEPPPTAKNASPFIVLENGRLPSFLSSLLPHGINAKLIAQDPDVGQRYLDTKSDIERLSILCNSGGAAGGGIKVLGADSKSAPRDLTMVKLTPKLMEMLTSIDPTAANQSVVDNLKAHGISSNQLVVNMTGHRTTLGVLAYDEGREQFSVLKLPSGELVDPKDEPKMQAVMLKLVQAAQKEDSYSVEVYSNKETGYSLQKLDYAYNDFVDFDAVKQSGTPEHYNTNHPTYLAVPITDFLSPDDQHSPTYRAIAETICPLIKNPIEAKKTLAAHMLMQHTFHTTNVGLSDLVMVATHLEPDQTSGGHFNLVLQAFGMTPDPTSYHAMTITAANGFYNGANRSEHNGMVPMDNPDVINSLLQKEFGLSASEANDVYRNVKQAIYQMPDFGTELDLSKEQFMDMTSVMEKAFPQSGSKLTDTLVSEFVQRKQIASQMESAFNQDNKHDRENDQASIPGATR